ncbi:tetratricopeptide repeat protein [Brevundimonas sp. R86498]|uniref:tetratricopeptide repeat protein n=1 Tax=Brevundimonas sp. R86498 TaxID=3093845 RepID=UPI0037C6F09B
MSVQASSRPAATSKLDDIVGDAASADRLAAMSGAMRRTGKAGRSQKQEKARLAMMVRKLQAGLQHLAVGEPEKSAAEAMAVLQMDERYGLAWHVLAISLEKSGELEKAFAAYEAALKLLPDDPALIGDLGGLAHRLDHLDLAEKLYLRHLALSPGNPPVANNLASVYRNQNRYGEAIDLLSTLIAANPEMPLLWNSLGTVLSDRGEMEQSLPFYDEAIRLDPGFYKARYNRANVRMGLGDPEAALRDIDLALAGVRLPEDIATMAVSKALTQMMLGDMTGGFETYEARFAPALPGAVGFEEHGTRWEPTDDLEGKTLLIYGEQGLGDEILFANVLADTIEAVGPKGKVILSCVGRLVPLFQRSYPDIQVCAHRTLSYVGRLKRFAELDDDAPAIDLWTPMASLFRRFRDTVDRFPDTPGFLRADPARVAHWKGVLDAQGRLPKVGVMWKSLLMKGNRVRGFVPFDLWPPVLATPGIQFVNLQYGDCSEEMARAEAAGLALWTPPGIDLKDDLDDVAALCSALDLVVGPMAATTNIAAGCGTASWVLSMPDAWTRFGTDHLPCYPSVRLFPVDGFGDWDGAMSRLGDALRHEIATPADSNTVAA